MKETYEHPLVFLMEMGKEDLPKESLDDRALDERGLSPATQEDGYGTNNEFVFPPFPGLELFPISPHGAGTLDEDVGHYFSLDVPGTLACGPRPAVSPESPGARLAIYGTGARGYGR
jgi:hypothetical protein